MLPCCWSALARVVPAFADAGQGLPAREYEKYPFALQEIERARRSQAALRDQGAQQPVPSFTELAAALQPARLLESAREAAAAAGLALELSPRLRALLPEAQLRDGALAGGMAASAGLTQ